MNKTSNIKQFEWAVVEKRRLVERQDFVHIVVLVTIALVIGVYLIATTVLIAKDGVCYINYAKALEIAPIATIRDCSDYAPLSYTPGYPFLILVTHKFVDLFCDGTTVLSWIYSAQSINLLCRLLALIPLYFIGKELVTTKQSFWAIFILVIQPYSAHIGSDVLRDWPHILFLATGFLLLLYATKYKKWWLFAFVGVISALGYIIRPMCIQLLIYGILWLIYITFKPEKKRNFNKTQIAGSLILLLIGFFIIAGPYMKLRGQIMPTRLQQIIENFSTQQSNIIPCNINTANIVPSNIAKAIWRLIEELNTNLMYFFTPFWLIGYYLYFRRSKLKSPIKFLMTAFILLNLAIVILRYVCSGPALSGRYVLPLIVTTIFFIPIGLQQSAQWIDKLLCKTVCKNNISEKGTRQWFFVLLVIGLAICLPKLFRPIRIEKKGYQTAIKWLKKNTPENSVIAVPDPRICFYAEREILLVKGRLMSPDVNYTVKIHKNDNPPMISSDYPIERIFKVNKEKELAIYKMAFKTN